MEEANDSVRAFVSVVLGLFVGVVIGPLFAPEPTGLLAGGLTVVVAAVVASYLYWVGFAPAES